MNYLPLIVAMAYLAGGSVLAANINSVADGGSEIVLEDLLTDEQPAVLLIYTPWDQTGKNLMGELEDWASAYTDLDLVLIESDSPMTAVARQFALDRLPAILVFDKKGEQVGEPIEKIYDLERLIRDHRIID